MSSEVQDKKCDNKTNSNFNPKLTYGWVLGIVVFFMLLLLLGLYYTIHISILSYEEANYSNAIKGICFTSLLGTSIFYSRKLYKMSIGSRFSIVSKEEFKESRLEALGSIIYFVVRPIYSVSFSIVIFLGIFSGAITISNSSDIITSTFINFMMFISFFVGFSSGKILERLQDKSQQIIDSIWSSSAK